MLSLRQGWTKIIERSPMGIRQGRDVYVANDHLPMYQKLVAGQQKNFYLLTLMRALVSLNADAHSGFSRNGAATLKVLQQQGFAVEYILDNGDVLIKKLHFSADFQTPTGLKSTGLYQVNFNGQKWLTNNTPNKEMFLDHKWNSRLAKKGPSHYASVSGKFVSKGRAGELLVNHIKKAYKEEIDAEDIEKANNHYSLYWINKGEHGDVAAVDGLTSLIQQAADAKAPVNWLIHGEGAKTFQRSLEVLKYQPSLSRFAAADEETSRYRAMAMASQQVFISNPVGADVKKIEALCGQVGITFVASHINTRNLKGRAALWNVAKELSNISAAAVATGVSGSVMGATGLAALNKAADAAVNAVGSALTNPSMATGVAALAGIVFVGSKSKAAFTKLSGMGRAVQAMSSSTFGSGNQYWFDSDQELLDQLQA